MCEEVMTRGSKGADATEKQVLLRYVRAKADVSVEHLEDLAQRVETLERERWSEGGATTSSGGDTKAGGKAGVGGGIGTRNVVSGGGEGQGGGWWQKLRGEAGGKLGKVFLVSAVSLARVGHPLVGVAKLGVLLAVALVEK